MKYATLTALRIDKEAETLAADEEMLVEPLSPTSVVLVRTLAAHIVIIVGLDSPINLDDTRAQLPLVLNHHRFSSLLVGDWKKDEELKWVKIPQVNIDDHLIVPTINPSISNNLVEADRFVEEYLHDLTKTSIDTSKPPWEIHILNLKTCKAESLAIIRIHHSLGDGISITSHILAWTRLLSNPDALPTIAAIKNKKEKREGKTEMDNNCRCWKLPKRFILAGWWLLQVIWNTFIDVLMVLATTYFLKDSDMIAMARPETYTKQRRIVYKILSLDDMKLIKNAMNVTINDVVIGLIQACFSRYLARKFANDNKHKEKTNINKMLKKIRMRMSMIVNLRPFKGIQGLEDIKNKDSKLGLGNQVGFVIVPLSIRVRDDPLEYVRNAKATVDRKKLSFEAKAIDIIRGVTMKLFGYKAVGSMTMNCFSNVSICASNVPGPMEETGFFGNPIKFIAPTVYGFPTPIMIHLQSCTNKMTIVISVREDVMIDPHELCDDMFESLLLIKDAVLKK